MTLVVATLCVAPWLVASAAPAATQAERYLWIIAFILAAVLIIVPSWRGAVAGRGFDYHFLLVINFATVAVQVVLTPETWPVLIACGAGTSIIWWVHGRGALTAAFLLVTVAGVMYGHHEAPTIADGSLRLGFHVSSSIAILVAIERGVARRAWDLQAVLHTEAGSATWTVSTSNVVTRLDGALFEQVNGRTMLADLVHPDDLETTAAPLPPGQVRLFRLQRKDEADRSVWVEERCIRVDRRGSRSSLLLDVTARQVASRNALELGAAIERAPSPVAVVDQAGVVRHANAAVARAFEFEHGQVIGNEWDGWTSLEEAGDAPWSMTGADGRRYDIRSFPVVTDEGETSMALLGHDVTEQWRAHNELATRATTDHLTGLLNRHGLEDSLEHSWTPASRLLLFDLDGFKQINDTIGHAAGDEVLRVVGERISNALRPGDIAARLGGDEFIVATDIEHSEALVERLVERVMTPVNVDGTDIDVHVSAGSAGGTTPDEALRHADVAMYTAKATGTAHVASNDATAQSLRLASEVEGAIERREFVMHHQPQMNLVTGEVDGVEALVRWEHPDEGQLSPDRFLDAVTSTESRRRRFHDLVVATALDDLVRLRRTRPDLVMAINFDPRSLSDPELGDGLLAALAERDIPVSAIRVELTEAAMVTSSAVTNAAVHDLAARGLALSIDDFGTGYSALSYLARLPIAEIKLDRSLTQRLDTSPRDRAVAAALIGLAAELGIDVIAEGVEDAATSALLTDLGCQRAQGWLWSAARPTDDLIADWADDRRLVTGPPSSC